MSSLETTCWTEIRGAAAGRDQDRESFACRYRPVVRAYLLARWRGTPRIDDAEDAVQEVFVDCFREGGVLERADADRPGGFRAFLFGVVRTVALRFETPRGRARELQPPSDLDAGHLQAYEAHLSQVFDRAWAQVVLRDALDRHEAWASVRGDGAPERLAILRDRIYESQPIRDIAATRNLDPVHAHRAYAQGRKEFKRTLKEALAFHLGATRATDEDLARLLKLIGGPDDAPFHAHSGDGSSSRE